MRRSSAGGLPLRLCEGGPHPAGRDLAEGGHGLPVASFHKGFRAFHQLHGADGGQPDELEPIRYPPDAVFYGDSCHGRWQDVLPAQAVKRSPGALRGSEKNG
jgi:hypothetical protein